ncbi:MAG: peptidylprolyl isomerase [Flavobacteriales bacterium]|nr:MAG: peptidylprolyl isomerase [Flavobacteriales bacterium]
MAILSKIRERSIFLIVIIALALFSFVIGDVFTRGGFGGNSNSVGEINNENISVQEFAALVEQQRNASQGRNSQIQSVNAAWNNLIRQKVYESQLEKSGIVVGEKDVWEEIKRQPFVQNSPQFKNEAGLFDEDKLKEYIAGLKDAKDDNEQSRAAWLSWRDFEENIKTGIEIKAYNSLVSSAINPTFPQAENYYTNQNTKLNIQYVYVPFTAVKDSVVSVSDDEIKNYVKNHPKQFDSEATRDVSYVKFDLVATAEDEAAIKSELEALKNDREEYSNAAKGNITIKGLKNTEDITNFFRLQSSDLPLDERFYTKNTVNKAIADTVFNMNIGDVYGPFKDAGYFKITKLIDVKQLPDSVKARHILISYAGSAVNDPSITLSETEAKKQADSLLTVVKNDPDRFGDLAKELSADKMSAVNGGDLKWFTYNAMVPEFRDFTFENSKGTFGVVKTQFGFHVIEVLEQKNSQKQVKLATFARKIDASEETENAIYQKAELFASELNEGKDLESLAKEQNVKIQQVVGLKPMDERVSALGNQRQIVNWAFNKDTELNDIKRFDVDKGYTVVKLTGKRPEGLNIGNQKAAIRTKLLNEKKTALIKEKMSGKDLKAIANAYNTTVLTSNAVSLASPALPNIGRAEQFAGIIVVLDEGKQYTGIPAKKGVFAVKILKKELPPKMDNYAGTLTTLKNNYKSKNSKLYETLKEFAEIEDNRATFY